MEKILVVDALATATTHATATANVVTVHHRAIIASSNAVTAALLSTRCEGLP